MLLSCAVFLLCKAVRLELCCYRFFFARNAFSLSSGAFSGRFSRFRSSLRWACSSRHPRTSANTRCGNRGEIYARSHMPHPSGLTACGTVFRFRPIGQRWGNWVRCLVHYNESSRFQCPYAHVEKSILPPIKSPSVIIPVKRDAFELGIARMEVILRLYLWFFFTWNREKYLGVVDIIRLLYCITNSTFRNLGGILFANFIVCFLSSSREGAMD